MGKMARNKGANGERAVVRLAREYELEAQRTAALQAAQGHSDADVLIQGVGYEVKRCQTLRMSEWLAKSKRIIFRRNHEPWMIVVPFQDYLNLLRMTT